MLDYDKWQTDKEATATIQQKTLQMREYASIMSIGKTTLESMHLDMREDVMTKELVQRLSASILSDKIVDDEYKARYRYSVYASWWQHFKHDKMPKWFVKRYPVVKERKSGYVTVKFERYAEYPKANVALQQNRNFYEVHLGGFERIVDRVEQIKEG